MALHPAVGLLQRLHGHAGERLQVDFMAPREASQEALDSAFLNTLAQQVEIEYLRIG